MGDINKLKANLEANGFVVNLFETPSEAADFLNEHIDSTTVSFGGSKTLDQMGLFDSLSAHNDVIWHWYPKEGSTANETRMAAKDTKVYLSSVNAVAETALKLVLAVCGELNSYQLNSGLFERNSCPSFKEFSGLKATVFGAGNIGRKIYGLLEGCGAVAYAVDIRCDELNEIYENKVKFISPEHALNSDIIVCAMN